MEIDIDDGNGDSAHAMRKPEAPPIPEDEERSTKKVKNKRTVEEVNKTSFNISNLTSFRDIIAQHRNALQEQQEGEDPPLSPDDFVRNKTSRPRTTAKSTSIRDNGKSGHNLTIKETSQSRFEILANMPTDAEEDPQSHNQREMTKDTREWRSWPHNGKNISQGKEMYMAKKQIRKENVSNTEQNRKEITSMIGTLGQPKENKAQNCQRPKTGHVAVAQINIDSPGPSMTKQTTGIPYASKVGDLVIEGPVSDVLNPANHSVSRLPTEIIVQGKDNSAYEGRKDRMKTTREMNYSDKPPDSSKVFFLKGVIDDVATERPNSAFSEGAIGSRVSMWTNSAFGEGAIDATWTKPDSSKVERGRKKRETRRRRRAYVQLFEAEKEEKEGCGHTGIKTKAVGRGVSSGSEGPNIGSRKEQQEEGGPAA
ncbi:hypothetical protein Syun_007522 [Stephania yunnanensis]|uniref:Uncharacterized protein n=1 Tax=Stephania yunnanensis TaxID=152371 RepID=A0AAP0KYR5_9MAGN